LDDLVQNKLRGGARERARQVTLDGPSLNPGDFASSLRLHETPLFYVMEQIYELLDRTIVPFAGFLAQRRFSKSVYEFVGTADLPDRHRRELVEFMNKFSR
jgi:hypothetical protein